MRRYQTVSCCAGAPSSLIHVQQLKVQACADQRRKRYDSFGATSSSAGSRPYTHRSAAASGYDPFRRADWTRRTSRSRRSGGYPSCLLF